MAILVGKSARDTKFLIGDPIVEYGEREVRQLIAKLDAAEKENERLKARGIEGMQFRIAELEKLLDEIAEGLGNLLDALPEGARDDVIDVPMHKDNRWG